MKTSNKILFIAAAAILAGIVVLAVASRSVLSSVFSAAGPAPSAREAFVETTQNLKDFTGVRADAAWEIDIKRGESYGVNIQAPPAARGSLIVRKSGDSLELGWAGRSQFIWPLRLKAEIVMPRLESIELSGAVNARVAGFKVPKLAVVSQGAGNVVCRDSEIGDLRIAMSGAGSVDFSSAPSVNADVELSGAGSLKLTMAGGELRGNLSGVGSIEYEGNVSSQEVSTSGLGSVRRR
ncbi:MAG: DUF2807 domain-containing protein [Spirochaetales bacterium]|nr:DUF2807 domain-containing protein [Spirochaetales bacterium]